MAQVFPFRAFRYNPAHAPFERVLTQPYDKISPAMQEKYYAASPHNLIAVEKGRVYPGDAPGNNVYTQRGGGDSGMDSAKNCGAGSGAFVLWLHAGVHRAGNQRAADAARIYRRGTAGGIFRGSDLPARAHFVGSEGRPAGIAAAYADVHRAIIFDLFRRAEKSGRGFERSGKFGGAGDGNDRRIWSGAPFVGDCRAGARESDSGSDGRAEAGDCGRASPLRDGAELSERTARAGGEDF